MSIPIDVTKIDRRVSTLPIQAAGASVELPPVGGTVVAWFDASNSDNDITLVGSDVSVWASKGGTPLINNGDTTFVEETALSRPALVAAGLGGLNYVRFAAGNVDRLTHASGADRWFETGSPVSVYMLMRQYAANGDEIFFAADQNSQGPYNMGISAGRPYMQGVTSLVVTTAPGTAWHGLSFNFTTSGAATNRVSQNRVHKTGVWTDSDTIDNSLCYLMQTGLNMDVAEIIIVSGGAETTITHGAVLDGWNTKWGLSL
jgi:hypothetical protein